MNGFPIRLLVLAISSIVIAYVSGCAGSGPFRHAADDFVSQPTMDACAHVYVDTDKAINQVSTDFRLSYAQRNDRLLDIQKEIKNSYKAHQRCWETAHEVHASYDIADKHYPGYDLFYTEFDDAGQPVDRVKGAPYEQSELHLVEDYLLRQLKAQPQSGINIVVFTHGWHGSARADDTYSIEFKGILQGIARREQTYSKKEGGLRPNGSGVAAREHHILGIEVAWRGDSILFPSVSSVWDRKLAAETVSIGAVHELFAFLNQLYLDNSCDVSAEDRTNARACDRVHLLTIGHSYGALITFRSLVSRLQSGLSVDNCLRAYGFGDMTVLLNPAFEAARYRALFSEALDRHVLRSEYYGDPNLDPNKCAERTLRRQSPDPDNSPAGLRNGKLGEPIDKTSLPQVQIPTIVTLQSEGDWATHIFFPIFRHLTTPFAKTLTAEETNDKNAAIGWDEDFRTHKLSLLDTPGTVDSCATAQISTVKLPAASQTTSTDAATSASETSGAKSPSATLTFCPFAEGDPVQADDTQTQASTFYRHLMLQYAPGTTQALPNYMPLWSVDVSSDIMKDHDDFWNPRIVRLISILFEDAYEQTEHLHHSAPAISGSY